MNKALIVLLISAILFSTASPSFAWIHKADISKKVCSKIEWNSEQNEILNYVNRITKLSNERNLEELKNLFSSSYVSGDGMDKKALFEMINDTWTAFPQLKYSSTILKIDVNGNYATVESIDAANANGLTTSELKGDNGLLQSSSHGLIYLRKYNNKWMMITDRILSEETILKYGTAKTINIRFVTPPQVKAGDDYTASVYAEIPPGVVAIASITKESIVHPYTQSKEVFRQISSEDNNLLERFFKANSNNLNELATVSVGFSEATEDENASPDVKLSGLTVITKRINIIPVSLTEQKKELNINTDNSEPDDDDKLKDMDYENK